ncbi:hypothetical protein PsorP6_011599 [Peronosclerospora sorghi]|uniref:Uncharacterized protein n=1 Tax=Peronosclerospora sorghi TaxID=230839 RepID=A0ACC0WI58_9STRA|nr:hypothetical protein PsorP6_011599 [Peronosclerospora sorghi]
MLQSFLFLRYKHDHPSAIPHHSCFCGTSMTITLLCRNHSCFVGTSTTITLPSAIIPGFVVQAGPSLYITQASLFLRYKHDQHSDMPPSFLFLWYKLDHHSTYRIITVFAV